MGTSNGLYSFPLDLSKSDLSYCKGIFSEVNNTKGQVWSLSEFNHRLLMGHQDGAFIINDNTAVPLMNRQGVWSFKALQNSGDLIASTYTGLEYIKSSATGSFTDGGKPDGIYESLDNIAVDANGDIWASHPFRGIFKIRLSADKSKVLHYSKYTQANGLPSAQNNLVYFIDHKIIATTEKGIYEYDSKSDRFIRSAFFDPIFKTSPVEYFTTDIKGNIWFVSNRRVGVIDFSKKTNYHPYEVMYFPELTDQTVKGSEFIYPYNNENIFIGSNDGIFHLNYSRYTQSATPLKVVLSTVQAIAEKDSLIFGGYFFNDKYTGADQSLKQVISLPNSWNSFHFEYSFKLVCAEKQYSV